MTNTVQPPSTAERSSRPLDLVVFGATGYTGGLVAEHLARHVDPARVRWGLAGRDLAKLEAVRARLAAEVPAVADVPLIAARSDDAGSLLAMAQQARVVLTTVGPFSRYGEPLVRACVAARTDYVDSTGEPEFWARIIAEHHDAAAEAGVKVIPCCGFDSIPHDMGAYFAVRELARSGPLDAPVEVRAYVQGTGKPSGGTWTTAVEAMAQMGKGPKSTFDAVRHGARSATRTRRAKPGAHWVEALGRGAMPMPTVDPMVVRRSAHLRDGYGPEFTYGHYLAGRPLKLASLALGAGAVFTLARFGPTRRWLLGLNPAGQGPTAEERARARTRVTFLASCGERRQISTVTGDDPGYGGTAIMLTDAAMCLLHDELPAFGGVGTTAAMLGDPLIERLHGGALEFKVTEPAR